MNSNAVDFQNIDYGTKPTAAVTTQVVVNITDVMLGGYSKAYRNELYRRNPVRAEEVGITEEELQRYFQGILAIRVKSVQGVLGQDWRLAKQLLIPSFIEFAITCIGEVYDVDRGLLITPECDYQYDLNSLLETSTKLRMFKPDGILLHQDAFPRTNEGDTETMAMAIINDYVYSMEKSSHPVASYVAAFLGFKLKEEAALQLLYRIRYDDVQFIANSILNDERIIA